MTEYTSIRVTVDAKEDAAESKRDDETWNEYLQRCTDNPPEVREYVAAGGVSDQLDRIERVVEQNNGALGDTVEQALTIGEHGFTDIDEKLDRIESAAKEATNAAQNAERAAEELGGQR